MQSPFYQKLCRGFRTVSSNGIRPIRIRLLPYEWVAIIVCVAVTLGLLCLKYTLTVESEGLQKRLVQEEKKAQGLAANTLENNQLLPEEEKSPTSAEENYLKGFPSESVMAKVLQDMELFAQESGLSADQASYRFNQKGPADGLSVYEISAPVKGSYPMVKRFIQKMLNAYPSITLRDVSMQRSTISDPQVEADLNWVLYVQAKK